MIVHTLSDKNSILNHFLSEIRDVEIQTDRMRFRKNMERIGEIMSYEISQKLSYKERKVTTPLGIKKTTKISNPLVICSILRAGLSLHNGFLNYFDAAENGFISAFRHHPNQDDFFEIVVQYQAVADINGKTLLLIDPMLASGHSMVAVFQKLIEKGCPSEIHLAVVIASPEGINYLKHNLPDNCHLWVAALDDRLNEHSYIVPGLGDAGDLAYGTKL